MAYKILKEEQKRSVKGVLFDLDGLVLDTEKLYVRFWMEAAEELGYSMSYEQALGMRSLTRELGQKYLEECFGKGIDHEEVKAVRIRRMNAYIEEHGVETKPGIRELLDYLHEQGIRCAITSSSPTERIREHLTPHELWDRFDAICSGYEVEHGKPFPDIYLYGASELQLEPGECLALEDSPTGILSAFRADCLPVVIPDLDEPGEDTLERCFGRADSLTDVINLIREING